MADQVYGIVEDYYTTLLGGIVGDTDLKTFTLEWLPLLLVTRYELGTTSTILTIRFAIYRTIFISINKTTYFK
jgi:hypothetical protein